MPRRGLPVTNGGPPLTGVILAAGEGRRMAPITLLPKPCLPVGNMPLIAHQLSLLTAFGVRRVLVVIGAGGNEVRKTADRWRPDRMEMAYANQLERRGIAHALQQVRNEVGELFVVILGDLYPVRRAPLAALRRIEGRPDTAAVLSIRTESDPDRIRSECSVAYDRHGCLRRIVEKPETPLNHLKPCGLYVFRRAVFAAIEQTRPSALRGEVELTDAIQRLVDRGLAVRRAPTLRDDVNINTPRDLLRANILHLAQRSSAALVHKSARVDPRASLERAVVGPRARIAAGVRLRRVVVLADAEISEPGTYADVIVGPGVEVRVASWPRAGVPAALA
jgi:dTDP-glucose pyrophosphorylase